MSSDARVSLPARTVTSVLGLALGALWWVLAVDIVLELGAIELVLFAAAAAVTELLPIRVPGGRPVPTSLAVIGTAAMLGAAPPLVALIAAGGWALARVLDRGPASPASLLFRALTGWALAGVAAVGASMELMVWPVSPASGSVAGTAQLDVGMALLVAVALFLGPPVLETVSRPVGRWRFIVRRAMEAIHANRLVGIAMASIAVLGALVHPVLGQWTLPTMIVPLLAVRVGLDRFAVAVRAYDQTLRAMSRLPEHVGGVEHGHGVRVGRLARQVALELGLDAALVEDVERAAHLHEVGRVSLERDVPHSRRDLAIAGAHVIDDADGLDRVARIVAAHGDVYRAAETDPEVVGPARIVAACCELDRYERDPADRSRQHEIVVRLVREIGDLEVVGALTRVLERLEGSQVGALSR